MATTATRIVPDTNPKGQRQRKPMSKAHRAKLAAKLAEWRAGLTEEDKEAQKERNRQTHQQRWNNMSERERRDRLAGVKAWQKAQRAAKRAEAKAKPAPKASPKAKAAKAPRAASVWRERTPRSVPEGGGEVTRRIRVGLNCGHGRLLNPNSDEAYDVGRNGTALCDVDDEHAAVDRPDWERVHVRVFGVNFGECVFVGEDACAHSVVEEVAL